MSEGTKTAIEDIEHDLRLVHDIVVASKAITSSQIGWTMKAVLLDKMVGEISDYTTATMLAVERAKDSLEAKEC